MRQRQYPTGAPARRSAVTLGLLACGILFFAVGFIGIFVPVMPTTVFWIIAAVLLARSSPALRQRILAWPGIGTTVDNFVTAGVIGWKSKLLAVAGMTVGAVVVVLTPLGTTLTIVALAAIALSAGYVLTRPSLRPLRQVFHS